MAVAPTSAMVDLRLQAGNGRPTAQNLTASGPDIPLALGAAHVLRLMSGGQDKVTLRELEVAMFLATYVDKERLGALQLTSVMWSLDSISAVIRSALLLGMETHSRGSMKAALHYMVSFIREVRVTNEDEFTFYRSVTFHNLPAAAAAAVVPAQAAWVPHLTLRSGIDSSQDATTLAVLVNLLPDRYTDKGRSTEDFLCLLYTSPSPRD